VKVYPFGTDSRAETPSDVSYGDYASSQDLQSINSGGNISFYAYENCQGVLLPDNPHAESKIPLSIPANEKLCTYLEMTASFSGKYDGVNVSSDNVKYRFYLGADNCSDFNVKRNTDINVHLKVTEDRIFDESWRVDYGADLPEVDYGFEIVQPEAEVGVGLTSALSANYYRLVDGACVYGDFTSVKSAKPVLAKVTGLKAVKGGKNKFKLSLKKVNGANGYTIYRAAKKNGKYAAVKTVKKGGTLKFTTGKLKKGKTFYFKVKAYRTVGGKKVYSQNFSNVVQFKVK
jgi:hypothetical protein